MSSGSSSDYGRWLASPSFGDEIVISGVSGKFPESNNMPEFGENLFHKRDLLTENDSRWKFSYPGLAPRGGKISNIDRLDAGYFGFHYRQVQTMDPKMRVFMEIALESIMDAGINPSELENTKTGVYVGTCYTDKSDTLSNIVDKQQFGLTGSHRSLIANRLSYFLKLKGPSHVVDTACSSSLFGMEHAFKALRAGEIDYAIVGGTNLILHPGVTLQFQRLGVLSDEGIPRVFDEAAEGYVRSEAICCVFLQRAKCAKRIYAQIIHTKTNSDGFKDEGITFPSTKQQAELMTELNDEASINVDDINFIEAHGTGTKVGDPQEVEAIDLAITKKRKKFLWVGSVKSSIGHTEPTSGLCSIVKVLIAMETGFISPNINLKRLKEGVEAFEKQRIRIVTDCIQLEGDKSIVGVNNFGFGGANCHVALRRLAPRKSKYFDGPPRLVCITGRTQESVDTMINFMDSNPDYEQIALLHHLFARNDPNHFYKGYAIVSEKGVITRGVKYLEKGITSLSLKFGDLQSNYKVLGKYLLQFPVFKSTLLKVNEILKGENMDVFENLNTSNKQFSILGSGCVQLAIAELLNIIGLKPQSLHGTSVGAIICSYFHRTMSLKEAVISLLQFNKKSLAYDKHNSRNPKKRLYNHYKCCSNGIANDSSDIVLNYQETSLHALALDIADIQTNGLQLFSGEKIKLLEVLGQLFLLGHNLKLHKLYPEVKFPVSRGTPMISPLIKWYHNKSWKTFKFSNVHSAGIQTLSFTISTLNDEDRYLLGHVIDGRTLFPATGYLNLVWQTLAQSRKLLSTDATVVFLNCKFVRAVITPENKHLELMVLLQKGTGKFEVLQGDDCVVTGYAYLTDNIKNHQTDYAIEKMDESDAAKVLHQDEIYRELYIRGYNYTGQFRGIIKSDCTATKGWIKWENNWVAFMDKMLQMKILQVDSRLLYVPVGIEKLTINPLDHLKIIGGMGKEADLPVQIYTDCNTIKAGAIEICGLQAAAISKKKSKFEPVLESYEFVPNSATLDLKRSLRVNTQIILENTLENMVKAVEVVEEPEENYECFLPIISEILEDVPLANADFVISCKQPINSEAIKVEPTVLKSSLKLTLVIGTNLLNNPVKLKEFIEATNSNGYVLSRELLDAPEDNDEVNILTIHRVGDEKLILLQRKTVVDSSHILTTSENFMWLKDIQKHWESSRKVVVINTDGLNSGILGLVNCLRRESGGSKISGVFIADQAPEFNGEDRFYKQQLEKNLALNVFKNGQWGTYRHLLLEDRQHVQSEHIYANVESIGDLSSFKWLQSPLSKQNLCRDTNFVEVYYSALNFKDVMMASGRISVDVVTSDRIEQECVQGFEFSGRDKTGRYVMGMVNYGALATTLRVDPDLLWPVPNNWSLEQAATVPVVYSTVIYALLVRTNLTKDTSILIHSATGGVGLAALNVAIYHGCEIFVTVGTKEKREYLKQNYPQIQASHIGNSRDTSFEQMIKQQTKGRGVDIVLNSLSEDKLKASVRCLAPNGRVMEIGRFDLASNNTLNLFTMAKSASYHGVMLDRLFKEQREVKKDLVAALAKGIQLGYVKPLPAVAFGKDELETAYRHMMTGRHMGKVLIKVKAESRENVKPVYSATARFWASPEKSYVIVGGLGGFGLELADWLVIRGARKIVLNSRQGIRTGYQTQRIDIWRSYGVEVCVSRKDVTTRNGCLELIEEASELGPVDGIFNLAVVLEDALFTDQTEEKFRISFGPKALATRHLDEISRQLLNLRYFVIFSSVSCGRGNPGQTNYGMANSIMERICEIRKNDGLPALAIQWGAIGDVGLVAKMQQENRELEIGGTLQQRIMNCLEVMDRFLNQDNAIVSSIVVAEKKKKSSNSGSALEAVAQIMGIKDFRTISHQSTLAELGMDSMRATEILQLLEKDFGIYLSAQNLRTLTFAQLTALESEKDNSHLQGEIQNKSLKIHEGTHNLLQFIPDYNTTDLQIIELDNEFKCNESTPVVFVFPGIEGVLRLLNPLSQTLKAKLYGVQYKYGSPENSIEEMARNILPHIRSRLVNRSTVNIVAYSFGTVVALETLRLLELEQLKGNLFLIDGSPDYVTGALRPYIQTKSDAEFETLLLFNILSMFLPLEIITPHYSEILNVSDFDARLELARSLIPSDLKEKEELQKQGAVCLYKRMKASIEYKFNGKLNSFVKLFRASQPVVSGMSVDYGLNEICEHFDDVVVLQADHTTIVNDGELSTIINNLIR